MADATESLVNLAGTVLVVGAVSKIMQGQQGKKKKGKNNWY